MPQLTELQSKRVEENMGLVYQVIQDCVIDPDHVGIYNFQDLLQIGCIGLCRAVQTDRPERGAFSTYAYMLIRNEIYTQLDYATVRRRREVLYDPDGIANAQQHAGRKNIQDLNGTELQIYLEQLLGQAEQAATGVTAKGIQAIRLLAEGYSNREIGERFGTTANNITAWVAKARKLIRSMAV